MLDVSWSVFRSNRKGTTVHKPSSGRVEHHQELFSVRHQIVLASKWPLYKSQYRKFPRGGRRKRRTGADRCRIHAVVHVEIQCLLIR